MDISKASHQEMRSLVCAQCHVEYYFDKEKVEGAPYLTFPWKYGFSAEEMEE
jgi:nitrite reductase (cytochrome c-552)